MSIEKVLSPLIESQFPSFYRDEGDNFISFVKAYYEWMEQANNVTNVARSLPQLRDIDTTIDDYIVHFKEKYLKNIEFESATNKRLLLKNSLDIYRSKGTDRSVDLLFKLIYGTGAQVYRPGDDILKLSDGEWTKPTYIEISHSRRTVSLVGKQVTGVTSGASAFVEKYVKRRVQDSFVHVLYMSNLTGSFINDELIRADTTYPDLPKVMGSMTALTVTDGGSGFDIGDVVTVYSPTGEYGQARVAATTNTAGVVDFLFIDGGFGYSNTPTIYISNTTLSLADVVQTSNQLFEQFETVTQPLSNLEFTTGTGSFAEGEKVFSVTGAGVGRILSMNLVSVPKTLEISRETGTFLATDVIHNTGNTANGTVTLHTTADITGKVVKCPTELRLVVQSNTNINPRSSVYQTNSTAEFANGTVTKVSKTVVTLENAKGTFLTSEPLKIRDSETTTSITSVQIDVALSDISSTFKTQHSPVVRGSNAGPEGYVTAITGGSGAYFDVLGIEDSETVYLNIDGVAPYMNVLLNATTYGLTANGSANISTYMYDCLAYNEFLVGGITGLTNINPGSGYSGDPEVVIHQPEVAGLGKHDYWMILANTSFAFRDGETIQQENLYNFYDLVVASNTGWLVGEYCYQGVDFDTKTGGGNIFSIIGNTIRVRNITGAFTNGSTLKSHINATTTTITTATADPTYIVTSGEVISGNTTHLHVARKQLDYDFVVSGPGIIGVESSATANIIHIAPYTNTAVMGLNALVTANVADAEGTVSLLGVLDSGLGYSNNQFVTFTAEDDDSGIARVVSSAVGTARGYFKSSKGFISNDKYLFDGDYYQEYSYEVLSRLPFDRYSEMLKKVLHVSGTKAFGSLLLESEADIEAGLNTPTTLFAYPPVEATVPTISGSQVDGQVLTLNSSYYNTPTVTYQWYRDSVAISGETNSTYTTLTSDVGKVISCTVTASNTYGTITATVMTDVILSKMITSLNFKTQSYISNRTSYSTLNSIPGYAYATRNNVKGELGAIGAVNAYGPEIITNGTFDTNVASWTERGINSAVSWQAGRMRIGSTDAGPTYAYQTLTVTPGLTYTLTADVFGGTGGGARIQVSDNGGGGSNIGFSPLVAAGASDSPSITFTPTISPIYVSAYVDPALANEYGEFDNISLKRVTDGAIINFDVNEPAVVPNVGYWARPSLTNLLEYSQQLDNAVWTKGSTTVTANATTAPDGSLTADRVTGTSGVTAPYILNATASVAAAIHTMDFWIKADTATTCEFGIYDSTTATHPAQTTVILSGPGTLTGTTRKLISGLSTTEWTRVRVILDAAATAGNTLSALFYPEGIGVSTGLSIYLWQVQLFAASVPNPPLIPTTSAAVTVGGDDLELGQPLPNDDFIAWAAIDLTIMPPPASAVPFTFSISGNGTFNERLYPWIGPTGNIGITATVGGVAQPGPPALVGAISVGRSVVMLRRKNGIYSTACKKVDGTVVISADASGVGAIPVAGAVEIGCYFSNARHVNGKIEEFGMEQGSYDDAAITTKLLSI